MEHPPHRVHVVARESPVARRIQIAEKELFLKSQCDASNGACDLSRDESLSASGTLVIEQNAVTDEHIIRLAIVHGVPVRGHLAHRIRTARAKRGRLRLRPGCTPEHLGAARLIDANLAPPGLLEVTHRLENPDRADADDVGGVLRLIEREADAGTRPEAVAPPGPAAV